MIRNRTFLLVIPMLALGLPAQAQQAAVVVPAEAGVVIAPRGAAPVASPPLPRRPRRAMPQAVAAEISRQPDVSPLLAALPLGVLAAVLAATLSNGGGGGGGGGISAPAQTTR